MSGARGMRWRIHCAPKTNQVVNAHRVGVRVFSFQMPLLWMECSQSYQGKYANEWGTGCVFSSQGRPSGHSERYRVKGKNRTDGAGDQEGDQRERVAVKGGHPVIPGAAIPGSSAAWLTPA